MMSYVPESRMEVIGDFRKREYRWNSVFRRKPEVARTILERIDESPSPLVSKVIAWTTRGKFAAAYHSAKYFVGSGE